MTPLATLGEPTLPSTSKIQRMRSRSEAQTLTEYNRFKTMRPSITRIPSRNGFISAKFNPPVEMKRWSPSSAPGRMKRVSVWPSSSNGKHLPVEHLIVGNVQCGHSRLCPGYEQSAFENGPPVLI